MVGMVFGSLAVMELSGIEPRDGPVFSDPVVNHLYLAGCIVLPILADSLALGADRVVYRSKWLTNILAAILCTPIFHWLLFTASLIGVSGEFLSGLGLSLFELATIASVPFLLLTGQRMTSQEPKTPLPSWVECTVVGGIIVSIVGLMLVPVVYHPHRHTRIECASNLKQIGLAMAMYSGSYQGRYPMDSTNPTLVGSMQLLSNILPSATVLYCYGDRRPGAHPEPDFRKLTTNNISYSYVPTLKWPDTPDSTLMADRVYATSAGSRWPQDGNHKGLGGNILFNDGHVSWLNELPSALKDKNGKQVVLSP
jgi:prepilin-type processing-associated H-X9-DG protein